MSYCVSLLEELAVQLCLLVLLVRCLLVVVGGSAVLLVHFGREPKWEYSGLFYHHRRSRALWLQPDLAFLDLLLDDMQDDQRNYDCLYCLRMDHRRHIPMHFQIQI